MIKDRIAELEKELKTKIDTDVECIIVAQLDILRELQPKWDAMEKELKRYHECDIISGGFSEAFDKLQQERDAAVEHLHNACKLINSMVAIIDIPTEVGNALAYIATQKKKCHGCGEIDELNEIGLCENCVDAAQPFEEKEKKVK